MILAPKPSRARRRNVLQFTDEFTAVWAFISRFIHAQIRAENVWRQPRSIPFGHMPTAQADYLAGEIDRGRD